MKKSSIAAVAVLAALVTAGSGASQAQFRPAADSSAGSALVNCGTTQTIGVAYPATGPAASIGVYQIHWAQFFASQWNKTHKRNKIRIVQGDTKLPDTASALSVAHQFASNSNILGLVGPAGSQEVQDTAAVFKSGGLAIVSGSATRVTLTRAQGGKPRDTPKGFFFRTVPNDGQQGDRVAVWIAGKLKAKRVYIIDDEESYSTGLADQVQRDLQSNGGLTVNRDHVNQSVSDFSSVITRIPGNTQVVFLPWQLAGKAQLFYTQLRAAGKRAIVFGSDGTFAPGTFTGARLVRVLVPGRLQQRPAQEIQSPARRAGRGVRSPDLHRSSRERDRDHEGVQERDRFAGRGAKERRKRQAVEEGLAAWVPGDVPVEEQGLAVGSRRHGPPRRLRHLQDRREREVQPRRLGNGR